ncbi:hypothetical protein CAPTEDRAFT_217168 [Capitella teleta]|uniref:Endonuclease/exonuclease/phosphatase domain-containing protein n=1 Tax=Capitella teleta TaxID=283909 RepID=R7TTN0_CAPTE|nr:hypothetical protein CAPTEDRAFT_217168 [Capitella teleta]|eukprot:ELT96972.1 hypothetical protein CAPTEDRAFT_217168 [Capitella teleta]
MANWKESEPKEKKKEDLVTIVLSMQLQTKDSSSNSEVEELREEMRELKTQMLELLSKMNMLSQTRTADQGEFGSHTRVKTFRNLLDTLNMSQHINKPTHQSGYTLDLLITNRDASERVRNVHVDNVAISDHSLITFTFATDRIQQQSVLKKCWKQKRMNMSDFTTTLERNLSALIQDCMNTQQLENLVYQYNQAVKSSLHTHAPI